MSVDLRGVQAFYRSLQPKSTTIWKVTLQLLLSCQFKSLDQYASNTSSRFSNYMNAAMDSRIVDISWNLMSL